jgi:preprotein translocase subunit SecA
MAGRGTDIKLEPGVAELGGLHVIGTTRHQSRRIDRQLRGRSARQGDPGSSKFFVSFEDALLRLFTSPRITSILQRFRPPEGEPISAKVLNRSIETAQKRVEQRNYQMRKHTLEYDDVMNKQRTEIYAFRNEVLSEPHIKKIAEEVLDSLCAQKAQKFFTNAPSPGMWDKEGFRQWLLVHFPVTFEIGLFESEYLTLEEVQTIAAQKVIEAFENKLQNEKDVILAVHQPLAYKAGALDADEILNEVLRSLLIRCIDMQWQKHLLNIDHLRTEVNLRVVGQKDPLLEFKHEAFLLFDQFTEQLKIEIAHTLFKFQMRRPEERSEALAEQPAQMKKRKSVEFKMNLSLMPELGMHEQE